MDRRDFFRRAGGAAIFEYLTKMCGSFGTTLEYREGAGKVVL